ncbi:MAG: type II toxin-antitoxin system RelE/ParE family toxin [Alphaproteobacteria bacterium]
MIRGWKNKALQELFRTGKSRKINRRFVDRIIVRLDRLHAAQTVRDMDATGFDLHQLKGQRRGTWSVSVSGAWRLTFRFDERKGEAYDVDFEQYH